MEWHLERAKSYGNAIADLNNLLRHDTFFQVHQEIDLLSLRRQVIHRCSQVGDALIDVYQRIEDYLNRVQRDYARARKLIRLCGLIERHEHLTATNLSEVATMANGPWFHEFRLRTLLDPGLIDGRPELLERALVRAGLYKLFRSVAHIKSKHSANSYKTRVVCMFEVYCLNHMKPTRMG